MRVRARSFLYLCLRIFFRRFLTTLLIGLLPEVHCRYCRGEPSCPGSPVSPPATAGRVISRLKAEKTLQAHQTLSMGWVNRLAQGSRDLFRLSLAHPDDPRMTRYRSRRERCSAKRPVEKTFCLVQVVTYRNRAPAKSVYISAVQGSKVKPFLLWRIKGRLLPRSPGGLRPLPP
jgi:hypothetical protein